MLVDKDIQNQTNEVSAVSFDEFQPTSYESWKTEAVNSLKGAPFEKKLFTKTYEGITLEPIYTMEHAQKNPHALEYPGQADFVRGTDAAGYIARPWTIAQASDAIFPHEVNEILRHELSRGNQTIHIHLNQATLKGQDIFTDEVQNWEKGLCLATLQDMDDTLKGVDVAQYDLHIYAGASVVPILGLLAAQAKAQGRTAGLKDYHGCVGGDPLGALVEEGSLPCFMDELYDEMALTIQWGQKNMPRLRTILVRGAGYHNGGANAIQEIAYCMSTAIAYIEALQIRGLDISTIAGQIRFDFSLGANFFMEIAKLRAARMIWAQIIKAFGGNKEDQKIDIFAQTSSFTQTVYDPYVNILRTTSQAFSGVVSGVDAMQVAPFDGAIGLSDEQSRRIARNIQLMFQNEFDMIRPIDPAGGSWYIETLTQQIAEEAWAKIQKISQGGGILAELKSGTIQQEVGQVLKDRLKKLGVRSDRAVGTNMYANMEEKPLEKPMLSLTQIKSERAQAIEEYLADIDEFYCRKCLAELPGRISGAPERFMQGVIEAFIAGATVSKVRCSLNDGFPGDVQIDPISPHRWTEQFEALRHRTEQYEAETGNRVRIFLANMGPIPQHKARADFSTGFMEVAHFEVIKNDGFPTVEEAAEAAVRSEADVAVICSTDDTYPELVPPLAKLIKAARPGMMILLAGSPSPEYKDIYGEAGVDDFIHIRANCYDLLCKIQKAKGIC